MDEFSAPPQACQQTLHVDEFGPVGLAVFVESVGVDQAGRVVVGVLEDRLQEGVVVRHGCIGSLNGGSAWPS
jgi:hypothetical protein